jgi:TadE-like protein
MVETALVLGVVLMLMFGTIQLAMLAFMQTAGDGAAFVAARAYAENPAGGAAYAQNAAHAVFGHVPAASIAVVPGSGKVVVSVLNSVIGLPVAGTPATLPVHSLSTEVIGPGTPAPSATLYPFSATSSLKNYYTAAGAANASYAIGLAQTFQYSGNGKNGWFAEWYCRSSVYGGISLPGSANVNDGSHFFQDPTASGSPLYAIYGWDTAGATCY